jgi:hypothetical protein
MSCGASGIDNTMQNESGRKNMLTNMRSLMFSFNLVDALLSMTALALNSCSGCQQVSENRRMREYLIMNILWSTLPTPSGNAIASIL